MIPFDRNGGENGIAEKIRREHFFTIVSLKHLNIIYELNFNRNLNSVHLKSSERTSFVKDFMKVFRKKKWNFNRKWNKLDAECTLSKLLTSVFGFFIVIVSQFVTFFSSYFHVLPLFMRTHPFPLETFPWLMLYWSIDIFYEFLRALQLRFIVWKFKSQFFPSVHWFFSKAQALRLRSSIVCMFSNEND